MRFLTLVFGILATTLVQATPPKSEINANIAGWVFNEQGGVHLLDNTGLGSIHAIMNKQEDVIVSPVGFHVKKHYQCSFYEKGSNGAGALIGTFSGVNDGNFGSEVPEYYACSKQGKVGARTDNVAEQRPVGWVVNIKGKKFDLQTAGAGHIVSIVQPVSYDTRPMQFSIGPRAQCKFYEYDYIGGGHGIGDLLGTWTNYAGNFGSRWAASYECYGVKNGATTDTDPVQARDMPCGYVKTSANRTYLINEGIKGHLMDFADDGATYNPVSYHVNKYCECRFYGAEKGHRNNTLELVKEVHGLVNGNFSCPDVSQYQCWVQMEDN